jgi:hypothetical protein
MPCRDESLWLDATSGRVAAPSEEPRLVDARIVERRKDGSVVIETHVAAPAHAPTQTPVAPVYAGGATYAAFAPYAGSDARGFEDLPGAWRVAVETADAGARWPWRAAIARPALARTYNRANLVLPAWPGEHAIAIVVTPPSPSSKLRVTLLRDGAEYGTRDVP